jgi:hypothetical protein
LLITQSRHKQHEDLMTPRITNIDCVKVVSLVFLFICHSTLTTAYPTVNYMLQVYLDSAFMFLSGYMLKRSLEKRAYNFLGFWKSKLTSFVIPFWVIALILCFLQREPNVPPTAVLVYATGLSFIKFSNTWGASILWFASCLLSFFLLFSLIGKYKKTTAVLVVFLTLTALVHFSTVNYSDRLLSWPFFTYILPFTIGFFWKIDWVNRKILITSPLVVLAGIGTVSFAITGAIGSFLSLAASLVICLAGGISMTLLLLYLFGKAQLGKLTSVITLISSGSLIIYLTEPLWGTLTGWLLYPQYMGNYNVQWLLTPQQSILRLLVVIPISFIVSSLLYHAYKQSIESGPIIMFYQNVKLLINGKKPGST